MSAAVSAETLPAAALATRINAEHQAAVGLAHEALEHARRAGELLIKAKAAVGHGKWLPWIEQNCAFGARQAQRYITLAESWTALSDKYDTKSHLSLTGALRLLSGPTEEHEFTAAEQRLLDKVRAAGGCSDVHEVRRLTNIQLRLLHSAFDKLNDAIDKGIADFSADKLRYALERVDDCIRILDGWLPEDVSVAVCAIQFKGVAEEHAAKMRRALEAAA